VETARDASKRCNRFGRYFVFSVPLVFLLVMSGRDLYNVVENLRRQEFLRMHSGEKSDDGLKDC